MCIIASKAAGVEMPRAEYIRNMFKNNDDGAGLMYAANGKVYIEKGYMKLEDFQEKLDELNERFGLKNLPLVMHFRITTHGGTKPENCHPFPITESEGMLKKLKCSTDVGIAHNGIINVVPRKGISDTMEYVLSQLAPLKKAVPRFYENKHLLQMIYNAIGSKMVVMNGNGQLVYIGDFREEDGVKYSNYTYAYSTKFDFPYSYSGYGDNAPFEEYDEYYYTQRELMWLDEHEGEYVTNKNGNVLWGDFAIDDAGFVYEYDDDYGMFIRCYSYRAFDCNGRELAFNRDSDFLSEECVAI